MTLTEISAHLGTLVQRWRSGTIVALQWEPPYMDGLLWEDNLPTDAAAAEPEAVNPIRSRIEILTDQFQCSLGIEPTPRRVTPGIGGVAGPCPQWRDLCGHPSGLRAVVVATSIAWSGFDRDCFIRCSGGSALAGRPGGTGGT